MSHAVLDWKIGECYITGICPCSLSQNDMSLIEILVLQNFNFLKLGLHIARYKLMVLNLKL